MERVDDGSTPTVQTPWPLYVLALVPPVVLGVALVAGFDAVPDPMPVHWGADGTPDSWTGKSLPLLLTLALAAPVVCTLGLGAAGAGTGSQGSGLPAGDDGLNTWAHAAAVQKLLAWAAVGLSTSLTVLFAALAGPWSWAGGGAAVVGAVGAVATLLAMALATGRISRAIDREYPAPTGRRTRWLIFVDAPGAGTVTQNNRGKYTLNTATTAGRVLAVALAVVVVVMVVEAF